MYIYMYIYIIPMRYLRVCWWHFYIKNPIDSIRDFPVICQNGSELIGSSASSAFNSSSKLCSSKSWIRFGVRFGPKLGPGMVNLGWYDGPIFGESFHQKNVGIRYGLSHSKWRFLGNITLEHILERSTIFKNGKPSISMDHCLTMAMLVITRGYILHIFPSATILKGHIFTRLGIVLHSMRRRGVGLGYVLKKPTW